MKGKGSGWRNESRRHSLARKGIRTADARHNAMPMRKMYAERYADRRLNAKGKEIVERSSGYWIVDENGIVIDEPFDTMKDALEKLGELNDPFATGESLAEFLETPEGEEFLEQHFESLYDIEYGGWREGIPYWIDNYEDEVTGENIYQNDFGGEILDHAVGIYDSYKFGEKKSFDGQDYYYAGSVSGGSGELELQADNGELVYGNIGYDFFRIWKPFPETYIEFQEDGTHALIHKDKTILESESPASTVGTVPEFDEKKVIKGMKEFARKKGWTLPKGIVWDEYKGKFVKE